MDIPQRIVIVKLTPATDEKEIRIYQGLASALEQLQAAGLIKDGIVETVLAEVPTARLHR